MLEITAKCGNRCDLCPLYRENFKSAEAETINDRLYKYHHAGKGPRPHYTRACDGCLSNSVIAREGCLIRRCAIEKALATCADCDQLFCSLLEADMQIIEGALAQHGPTMPIEDYERYLRPFLIRKALSNRRFRMFSGSGERRTMRTNPTAPKTIDEYIAGFPPDVQEILQKIRLTVRKAAPGAEETIKYRMPTFTLQGNLVHFAAFKKHIGFYPVPTGIAKFKKELAVYESGKGSVQFPLDKPMPYALISRIVKFRVKENLERATAKGKKS